MLTTVAVGLVNSADIQNVMIWALWSGAGGLASAVLTILERCCSSGRSTS